MNKHSWVFPVPDEPANSIKCPFFNPPLSNESIPFTPVENIECLILRLYLLLLSSAAAH